MQDARRFAAVAAAALDHRANERAETFLNAVGQTLQRLHARHGNPFDVGAGDTWLNRFGDDVAEFLIARRDVLVAGRSYYRAGFQG